MKVAYTMVLTSAIAFAGVAAGAEGRWSSGMRQGFRAHAVNNGPGNDFRIVCDEGYSEREGTKTHVSTTIGGKRPAPGSAITVSIDGQRLTLKADGEGLIPTNCPECARAFEELWVAIRKGESMTLGFADGQQSSFSLRGSASSLDPTPCPTAARSSQQTSPAPPTSPTADSEAILQAAYRQLQAGDMPKDSSAWFSEEFLRAVRKERRCEAKLGDQRYAGMMWLSGQDWEISDLEFSAPERSEQRPMLTASFKNFSEPQSRNFVFVKSGSGWRIDDVIANGRSLRAAMQDKC